LYPEWIVIDLKRHHRIEAVHLHPRADAPHAGQGFPEDFTIEAAPEGEPWKVLVEKKGYVAPVKAEAQTFAFAPCVARFVKVQATRLRPVAGDVRQHLFQLAEVDVLGEPVEAPPLSASAPAAIKPAAAANLRCQYRENPIGIDNPRPRLSWTMAGNTRGQRQTAYRILVAANRADLDAGRGPLWDSGKVKTDRSIAVAYAGQPLASGGRYFWKVMLWDKDGKPTSWSAAAEFVMGKLEAADWKGQWIGASEDPQHQVVYLRKEVTTSKPVRRATAFFCGLGWSELYIDGKKVSDWLLAPGNTSYHIRTQYVVHDVTEQFAAPGRKALGVILGDGWYALWRDPWVHAFERQPYVDKPKLLLDIELEYADGSTQTISSDESWKWSFGPITRNWLGVENIDLRRAIPDWYRTGYNEAAWKPVVKVKGPAGKLVVQKEPPTRIIETIKPQRLTQDPKSGAWIFEFGREFQGFPRLRARGPAGTAITIITHPTSQHTAAGSQFILAGKGVEEYEPRFHYNAVHRVEVRGLAEAPALDDLSGCFISADMPAAARFRSSDDTANWMNECVRRTQYAYVTGVPNDPTREKKGWTQDMQNMLESAAYLLDSQTLYERWNWDIHDGQSADGNCPNVAPGPFYDGYNSPWWGGCMVWGPWHWYLYYGDEQVLVDHYEAMKKYVDFQSAHAQKNEGLQKWGLADWLDVVRTPNFLINTPAHYQFARIVSRSAEILGHQEDAAKYAKVAEGVRDTFNAKFLDRASGKYSWQDPKTGKALDSQAVPALALGVGMVPDDVRKQAEAVLLSGIAERKGFLSTGFVSTPYLLDVLAELDPQVGHEMTMKRPAPSWYAMTVGANSDIQREMWGGGAVIMPSLGGNIAKWHFRSLAGVWPDESAPGFKRFIIKPNVVGDLHWVRCHYDSVHGRMESNWQRRGKQFVLEVTVPANTTATIWLPPGSGAVTESGRPVNQAFGVRAVEARAGRPAFEVASGVYRFEAACDFEPTREGSARP
jgi:alpha-L-rhamnosidase